MKKNMLNKKNIIVLILTIITSIFLTLIIQNNSINLGDVFNINIWLLLLCLIFMFFIVSHFLFKINDIYDYIYKKRYIISIIILLILVLGKFNGSSISVWNDYIEPSNNIDTTIVGNGRSIRSDEWLVNTPYALSQQYNDYNYYNNLPRATKTDMFASIFTPIKDILIISRPFNIGYLLFGEEYGLSFYWYGRLIALFLVSFEMCMLLSKKNKLFSFVGAMLIAGSSVVTWFYSNYIVDLLISGQLCLLLFDKYLTNNKKSNKIILSILIGLTFSWFALTIYPAWQIPLGYMYLVFAIWIFIKNYKNNKSIKDYLYLLISILIIMFFVFRFLKLGKNTIDIIMSTVYPGKRNTFGGGVFNLLFIYPYTVLFPFKNFINPCEVSGTFSLFPIPVILSMILIIKNRKQKDENKYNVLLISLVVLSIIFTLYTIFPFPGFIVKLTLLNMVPAKRILPIIQIIDIYLLILTIGKIKPNKLIHYIVIVIICIIIGVITIYLGNKIEPSYLVNYKYMYVALFIMVFTISILYFTSNKKIPYYLFCFIMILLSLINIIFVNPVNIGTDVIYDKKASKEIKKIVKQDKDARWIATNSFVLPNYALMQGAKVINSTNIYPNLKIWKKIDYGKDDSDIYNRYSHIQIELTESQTDFELMQPDYFKLYLNYNDIKKLRIDYIISDKQLIFPDYYIQHINEIYNNDNIYIYKIKE
ncbi:MAG: hypothetical protein IJ105_03595 [Bacilli bacterium]|nr:hypothetical protein [Bacilli bacterium]